MRRSNSRTSKLITLLAWLSLLSAFLVGHFAAKTNYIHLLSQHFPDSTFSKAPNSDNGPRAFLRHHEELAEPELLLIAEGQGFGGPLTLAVKTTEKGNDSYINEVILLSDRETPPYVARLAKHNFYREFISKDVRDNFILGDDIDGVSGATISSQGVTKAVQEAMHLSAMERLGLSSSWEEEKWQLELNDGLLLLLIAAILYTTYANNKLSTKLRLLIPFASLGFIGFYINSSLSIGSLAGLVMGYIPSPKQQLTWWIMMGSVLGAVLLLGKNIYCGKLCPFSTVQMLLHKISGFKFKISRGVTKYARRGILFLVWASLMLIFLSHHPAMGTYEPFSMMFSLEGMGMQWYVLPLSLFGALFIPDFWCRLFCPVGYSLNSLIRTRNQAITKFGDLTKAKPTAKAEPIEVQAAPQDNRTTRRNNG
ncbi:FMN-binding protein [Photobacterium sp. SDRW27]|uniref:FMN-binding protein n=1 Tax=Photobacterium obscurum TaxID=2829490 RepID=UPI0022443D03|nr:FMN-binding protein [Photobacterium obscurum]MCW8329116.1 FMN-binding protein [Photobacterium obscurum]